MMNAGGGRPFTPDEYAERIRRAHDAEAVLDALPKPGRVHLLPASVRQARTGIKPIPAFIPACWPINAPNDNMAYDYTVQGSTCDMWKLKEPKSEAFGDHPPLFDGHLTDGD